MKNTNDLLLKAWVLNVLLLEIFSWTLRPLLFLVLMNNLPELADQRVVTYLAIGNNIIYAAILLLTATTLALLFKKVLKLKYRVLFAFIPQFVLWTGSLFGQYIWWPPVTYYFIQVLITATILLAAYYVLSVKKGLAVIKNKK